MYAKFAFVTLMTLLVPLGAQAGTLPKPTGEVILTITGDIENTNGDKIAEFDMAMLDRLASRTTETATPWYDGPRSFSGPLVSALLEAVGGHGTTIRAHAVNDYSADIPIEDAMSFPVILATRINGAPMSVREKGPTFLIYPFDENPELYNEKYFGRSVWQIHKIDVF